MKVAGCKGEVGKEVCFPYLSRFNGKRGTVSLNEYRIRNFQCARDSIRGLISFKNARMRIWKFE
jgi:hypothetical protein